MNSFQKKLIFYKQQAENLPKNISKIVRDTVVENVSDYLDTLNDVSEGEELKMLERKPRQSDLNTNKNYSECSVDGDMAVIIDSIKFQNFNHDFKIFSQYFPDYPSDWRADGHDCPKAIHSNYLGWNGIWTLDFETPIYRWIHQRLDLGWLI
jgi:hypothetical protein